MPGKLDAFPSAFSEYDRPVERIDACIVDDDVLDRPRRIVLRERAMIPRWAGIARAEDTVDVDRVVLLLRTPYAKIGLDESGAHIRSHVNNVDTERFHYSIVFENIAIATGAGSVD